LTVAFTPLNSLNAFLAVARRRGFAAASRDLGVSKFRAFVDAAREFAR
jgi:hypothetical protein